jgi:hypothetical protein
MSEPTPTGVPAARSERPSGWRYLFGQPGVPAVVLLGALARLPTGMIGLAMILGVAASRSFALAGSVVACYSIALAVAAPVRARAVDRLGLIRVIGTTSLLQGAGSAVLACCLLLRLPIWSVIVLALACGLSAPPITPAMRAFWTRRFAAEPATRAVASSLESIIVDVSFVSGPGLVSIAVLAGPAPLALLAVGVLRATTGFALTSLPSFRAMVAATEPIGPTGAVRRDRRSPLRTGALLGLLPVALLAFGSISAIEVGVSSLAQSQGHRAAAGALIAILSVGGILGGLLRGQMARRSARPTPGQLVVALAILTLAWAAPIAVPALAPLAVVLLLAGVVMNPMISLHYDLLGDRVSGAHRTEAFGWMTSANAVGAALGAGIAGVLSAAGPVGGFAAASAMTALAALTAVLTTRLLGSPLPD